MPTPAQMRTRYRAIAHRYRSIPGAHGLREHTVSVRLASYSGTYSGDVAESGAWTDITENGGHAPKVHWANDEQIALGGLDKGDVTIGPITPSNGTVGTLLATLAGSAATVGQVFQIRITGPKHPDGALYIGREVSSDRALRYMMRARPVANT